MQVSVAQSPLSQSQLAMYQRQPATADDTLLSSAKAQAVVPTVPQQEVSATVHITSVPATPAAAPQQTGPAPAMKAEVFAEIWKDGMKIGSVYTDGNVVLSAPGAGVAMSAHGAAVPYLQAQEISRMVGGEVHYVDLHALQVARTRSQLHSAYGV